MQSATSRNVSFNQRRFLQTYRHVAFFLQILAAVATTATFLRICEQRRLPLVFLALPLLLFVVALFIRFTPVRDAGISAIVVGASTGAVAGFVSTVVDNSLAVLPPGTIHTHRSDLVVFICSLEFLHIPVIVGAVMYTFCLLFTRLPPVTLLVLAGATAVCGTTIMGIGLAIINDPVGFSGSGTSDGSSNFHITDWLVTLSVVFFGIFFASLLPLLRVNKQAWVVCFGTLVATSWWQTWFFDTMQWDWDKSHFPIPGTLVGIVVLFMIDVVEMTEAADVLGKRVRHTTDNKSVVLSEALLSSITWHVSAYIVERTSLTLILDSRRDRSKPAHRVGSDVWLCCLGMLGLIMIFSPSGSTMFTLLGRNVTICLGLTLYICITLASGVLVNGYFIDDILGLSILATTTTSKFAAF